MGLETATFINGLTPSWPLSGDLKSQGDDHLRLIKAVLQATFPVGSKAFYFPTFEISTTALVLDATDQNNTLSFQPPGGSDLAVTLPTLAAADKGWRCEVMKSSGNNADGIVVSPPSGLIYSRAAPGGTATIRIEQFFEPAIFEWSGGAWICVKSGPLIGSSMNWDGSAIPAGYRAADGTAYSTTTFAELNAALGTATLKDKRGRSEVGLDTGNVNMSSASWGASVTLGSVKSGGTATLVTGNLPAYTPSGANGTVTVNTTIANVGSSPNAQTTGGGGFGFNVPNNYGTVTSTGAGPAFTGNAQGGTSTPFSIVGPSIATNKLVRVC